MPSEFRVEIITMKLYAVTAVATAGLLMLTGMVAAQKRVAPNLDRLAVMMQGSYSNEAQSRRDTSYFDIRLRIARIWQHRTDAIWLYVEQSLASLQTKPYRQRVYRLKQVSDTTFENAVFTLRDPMRFMGEWRKENLLKNLTPDSLAERMGCAVILYKRRDGTFAGGTVGTSCPGDLRGAAYATSEVIVLPNKMISWDRGFDRTGRQTWGSVRGGYEFIKKVD